MATAGPPCSYASGISVSASDAMTAPAAKASGREIVSGSLLDNGPPPSTTATTSRTAHTVHTVHIRTT
jgi:hypothetical protein